ncbi:hypothetical protein WH87_10405 [Devosia epidermidihirudinis]|uniref:Zinc-finger protein n=1 Tax=Devosia epidermidihirudinis TaxID=1293439 RepID=A0A0F5QC52_9HYPH|nr:DUF983 domain-containing protein [Devosia epidermidihirudinis]KKC38301.1 hypothetical protein WH87_10405 [Devosia epidermidihirudinis]
MDEQLDATISSGQASLAAPAEKTVDADERRFWPAVLKGMRCRCPNCGKGKLFYKYLKVVPTCSVCGEDLTAQRADDLPPYLTIMIVGHILVFVMLDMELRGAANPWVYIAIFVPLSIIMPLVMLPSVKGFVVALQWSRRMHGFAKGGKSID